MELQLEGKRALVTGSTAGIGFVAALRLAREGAFVVINGRTEARVKAAVRRVQSEGTDARVSGVAALTARVPELDIFAEQGERLRGGQNVLHPPARAPHARLVDAPTAGDVEEGAKCAPVFERHQDLRFD